jgi:hypothetical protein
MSVSPIKADVAERSWHVRSVPNTREQMPCLPQTAARGSWLPFESAGARSFSCWVVHYAWRLPITAL